MLLALFRKRSARSVAPVKVPMLVEYSEKLKSIRGAPLWKMTSTFEQLCAAIQNYINSYAVLCLEQNICKVSSPVKVQNATPRNYNL